MSVLDRLSSSLGHQDDGPNKELAAELGQARDPDAAAAAVAELVAGLDDPDRRVQGDCIKVLYEVGYICPDLIAPYASQFLDLLTSRNNRLVWGAMIALSTIADQQAAAIYAQLDRVLGAIARGSVITVDAGITVLARVAAADPAYAARLVPYLLEHLRTCRPQSVALHAETCAVAVNAGNRSQFSAVLRQRLAGLNPAPQARVKRLLRTWEEVV
ncbi:MAG: hypothetical protein KKA73_06000 [Chloroflexi bacterium]|nr:hypothetical protein [Chloroflexota bacterium]MBU1747222.1 hypothetical protein [Chloroflexota bacterium]